MRHHRGNNRKKPHTPVNPSRPPQKGARARKGQTTRRKTRSQDRERPRPTRGRTHVMLKSGPRFGCSVTDRVKQFYRSLNSILRVEGRSENKILLRLIESHCVPVLTYGTEVSYVADRDERRSLRVAYNAIFRKLYGYRISDSVTNLQHSLGRFTWEETVDKKHENFVNRAKLCPRDSLVYTLCALMYP